MSDLSAQLLHIITITLLSKFAEAAEILADLGSGNVHLLAQRVGGDSHHTTVAQVGQLTVISGKTPNNSVRNIFLFQKNSLLRVLLKVFLDL